MGKLKDGLTDQWGQNQPEIADGNPDKRQVRTNANGQQTVTDTYTQSDEEKTKLPDYVPTAPLSVYQTQIPQDLLDQAKRSRESDIINTLLPNINPNEVIPSAAYQPMAATPVIQGFTPGSPLPIFGSPMAVNFPFELYDRRQRALFNAAVTQQQQKMAEITPPTFKSPAAYVADAPYLDRQFTQQMNDLVSKWTAKGVDFNKAMLDSESDPYQEALALSNNRSNLAQNSTAIARELQKAEADPNYPAWFKSKIHSVLSVDGGGVLSKEGREVYDMAMTIPNYQKQLQDAKSRMELDQTAPTQQEMQDFANTHKLDLEKDYGQIITTLQNTKRMSEPRIQNEVNQILEQQGVEGFAINKPQFFNGKKLVNPEGLVASITNDVRSLFPVQQDTQSFHVVPKKGENININLGSDNPKDPEFVPDYNVFLKTPSAKGGTNMDNLITEIGNAINRGKTPDGVNGWMTTVPQSLSNAKGDKYLGKFNSIKSSTQPLTFTLFDGKIAPLDNAAKFDFTANDVQQYISSGGSMVDSEGDVVLTPEAKENIARLKELTDAQVETGETDANGKIKVDKDGKPLTKRIGDVPLVYHPSNIKAAFVDIHGYPVSMKSYDNIMTNQGKSGFHPAMAVTMKISPTENNINVVGGGTHLTKDYEFTMYIPMNTVGGISLLQQMIDINKYKQIRSYKTF